jgi:hypothetical protein
MCIVRYFYHAHADCGHTVIKTYMCGSGVCRVPSRNIFYSHPGECLDCLGGNNTWPLDNYEVDATQLIENNSDMKAYAQAVLDLMVCVLVSKRIGADQGQGLPIFSEADLARTVATVILRARFAEKRCPASGESAFDKDVTCGCPAMLAPMGTQNPVRQCHLRVVQDANLDTFLQQLPAAEIELIKEQIAGAYQPFRPTADIASSLVLRPFSLFTEDVVARVTVAANAIKGLVDELQTTGSDVLPPQVHQYTGLSRMMLGYVASSLMHNDSGLPEPQMKEVLSCLGPCLIHPQDDPRRPASWTPYFCLDYTAFQYCIGAYMCRFPDSAAQVLEQGAVEFKRQLVYPIASLQNVALNKMQQTKEAFYNARISYYTTPVGAGVGTGEDQEECPICTEEYRSGATGEDEVLKIKRCNHCFHRGCLRKSLMLAARNRWGCLYCRQSIDGLEPDDLRTKCGDDQWWGYEGKLV